MILSLIISMVVLNFYDSLIFKMGAKAPLH